MKKLALLLAVLMLVSMLAACANDDGENKDTDGADTPAATDTQETDTTNAPETDEPETEAPETEEDILGPVQGEVPCNFDDAIDLSSDISTADFMLADGGGQWVLGDDAVQMANYITKDMLEEYKYIAFKYLCDYSEETYQIAPMLKFVHEDGTKTEFLCNEWFNYGPAGNTYMASSLPAMGVYCPEGVFYIETSVLLAHEAFTETDIIDQIGIASVEGTMSVPYLEITGAYLTK